MNDENPLAPKPIPLPSMCPRCARPTVAEHPFCTGCGFDLLFGQDKPPRRGSCLYCETVTDLTLEHVFGEWLIGAYGRSHNQLAHKLSRPTKRTIFQPASMQSNTPRIEKRDPYDAKVRTVCATCNNGWMSSLANAAKPLVQSLADGGWPDFSLVEQKTLSRWAALVAINLECQSRIQWTSRQQLNALMQGEMPEGWRVSICRHSGRKTSGFSRHQSFELSRFEDGTVAGFHNTYFCVEEVIFHCMSAFSRYHLHYALQYQLPVPLPLEDLRCLWPDNEPSAKGRDIYASWSEFDRAFAIST